MVIRCLWNAVNIYLQPRSPSWVPDNKCIYVYVCVYILHVYLLDYSTCISYRHRTFILVQRSLFCWPSASSLPLVLFFSKWHHANQTPKGCLYDSLFMHLPSPHIQLFINHLFFSSRAFKSTLSNPSTHVTTT